VRASRLVKEPFLDDYLNEAEQWEWLKGQIREYGLWILGGVLLGAAGIGGWFAWQSHAESTGRAASLQYAEVHKAFAGDHTQAMLKLGELERNYPSSPYVDQARLLAARSYVEEGQLDKAVTELQRVADTSRDPDLAQIARLRAARVQIAQKQPDAAIATLTGMKGGAFEARIHEVRGDAYYAKGDKRNALQEYRTAQLADMVTGGGGGGGDHSLLELKISDLVAEVPPAAAPAAPPATAPPAAVSAPPATGGAAPAPAK
jgi:predicted negative regulator of RcsB-dependent stress response